MTSAEQLFAGNIIVEADVKEKALAWLPDAMRFEHPVAEPVNDDGEDETSGTVEPEAAGDPADDTHEDHGTGYNAAQSTFRPLTEGRPDIIEFGTTTTCIRSIRKHK